MADFDPIDRLPDLDKPIPPPADVKDRVWLAVADELGGDARRVSTVLEPENGSRFGVWAGIAAAALVAAAIGFAAIGSRGNDVSTTVDPRSTTTVEPTTTEPSTTTSTIVDVDQAVGTTKDGFGDVEDALATARTRWGDSGVETYGYREVVDCDCPDAGERWHHIFDPDFEDEEQTIETLFDQIEQTIAAAPGRLVVSFSVEHGFPAAIEVDGGGGLRLVTIHSFHEIGFEPSPFDRTWRFVEGNLEGAVIQGPGVDGIPLIIQQGSVSYPLDCNEVFGPIDIYGEHFALGQRGTTDMGCGEYTEEGALFDEAMSRADTITMTGDQLVLSAPGLELRFTTPQTPELLGELPLAAAGETLSLEVPDGRERSSYYTINTSIEYTAAVDWLLTADQQSAGGTSWQVWNGIPSERGKTLEGAGPDFVTVPDTIGVGDYYLCSAFWEPDQFCFELPIRPASRPWFLTSGADGVVLHDANGTSEVLSTEPAEIAFSARLDDRYIVQFTGEPSSISIVTPGSDIVDRISLAEGERLLDVGKAPDTVMITSTGEGTFSTSAFTGDRTRIGPPSTEARVAGDVILLRTGPTALTAVRAGSEIWTTTIDEDSMFNAVGDTVRIDQLTTFNTDGLPAFYQYLETRVLDLETGVELGASEMEVAIPLDGHQIDEPCVRAEIDDGLLLCTQPDGRVIGLGLDGGEPLHVASDAEVATYVR